MVIKAVGVWFLFLIIAVVNGGLRGAVITPLAGEPAAHAISSILFAMIIFLITLGLIRFMGVSNQSECWLIGVLWLIMTIAFEFLFFYYVMGTPLDILLADDNILKGRLWVLVLMSTLLSPVTAAKIRHII